MLAISLQDLPPARDFILSAGFGGVAAVVAAVIVLCAVLYGSRRAGKRAQADHDQRERHHVELREDARRAVSVAGCWERWWRVLETASLEPAASEGATLGLGPEVTLELLRGLLHDAEQLGDEALAKTVATYQEQLLLVLMQQSGPLSRLAGAATRKGGPDNSIPPDTQAATPGPGGVSAPGNRPESASNTSAAVAPEPATAATHSAADEQAAGGRRRR